MGLLYLYLYLGRNHVKNIMSTFVSGWMGYPRFCGQYAVPSTSLRRLELWFEICSYRLRSSLPKLIRLTRQTNRHICSSSHIVQSVHIVNVLQIFTVPKKAQLCFCLLSLLIICYVFRLNCHLQGADTTYLYTLHQYNSCTMLTQIKCTD